MFIPDIRRGNLHMHLMYKALMEQSADRAEFLAQVVLAQAAAGLTATTPPDKLFGAFADVPAVQGLFDETRQLIRDSLKKRARVRADRSDDAGIDFILGNFFTAGPFLQYSSAPVGRTRYPSFAELQMATDATGLARAYLATEDNYRAVRDLQRRNLIVPLVADFAGPKDVSRDWRLGPRAQRQRHDALHLERGAVPVPGAELGHLCREPGGPAAR